METGKFGVWRVYDKDKSEHGEGLWCFDGKSPAKRFVSETADAANDYISELLLFNPTCTYEVRRYPEPETKPEASDWEVFNVTRNWVVAGSLTRAEAERRAKWMCTCGVDTYVGRPASTKSPAKFWSVEDALVGAKPAADFGTLTTPQPVRNIPVVDASALAYALFASDQTVIDFVCLRCEQADRFDAVARIAFDRDERGWATRSRIRAARIIDRMSK